MTSHRNSRYPKFRGRSRRGVLLMIVLAILAMFGLIGFAFVMMTSHARRGAKAFSRMDQNDQRPDELLHRAALQVFRGENNRASVIGAGGLLEDLYGNSTVHGTIAPATATPIAGGQLIQVQVSGLTNLYRFPGRVLTMLDGPAKGKSFRIVDQGGVPPAGYLHLVNEDGELSGLIGYANSIEFFINGAPFSGTGFGFDSGSVPLAGPVLIDTDRVYTDPTGSVFIDKPLALLPNWKGRVVTDPLANEDYDAVDYQNMLLAMQLPEGENDGISVPIPSLIRPSLINYWYHRLVNGDPDFLAAGFAWNPAWATDAQRRYAFLHPYGKDGVSVLDDPASTDDLWASGDFSPDTIVALKRKISLRPLKEDHPKFDGGNPTVDPVGGTVLQGFNPFWDGQFVDVLGPTGTPDGICDYRWDVDNDGDGVEDSIWVDLGLPVQQTEDGRLVKPLVAILCVDMDGRLNVNAHGNLQQANPANIPNYYSSSMLGRLPRGQGYGPADVNLLPLFMDQYQSAPAGTPDRFNSTSLSASLRDYWRLLLGKPYGPASEAIPDPVWALTDPYSDPGYQTRGRYGNYLGTARPGVDGVDDFQSRNKWFEYASVPNPADWSVDPRVFYDDNGNPTSSRTATGFLSGYGNPPDIEGDGLVAWNPMIDGAMYIDMGQGNKFEPLDDPYEIDLNDPKIGYDAVFAPEDLESLLRMYDGDEATQGSRLMRLTHNMSLGRSILADNRNEVTTESWDLPCPNVAIFDHASGTKYRSLAELALAKGCPTANLSQILSPEVRAGLRMNLNCPFGNGIDDNGNGVVDEPWEDATATLTASIYTQPALGSQVVKPLDFDNNAAPTTTSDIDPRQYVARYLYVLFHMVMGNWVDPAWANEYPNWNDQQCRAHEMAQWAVNIVDFMDRDSIMTGFEYDRAPFSGGWSVDGNLATNDGAQRGIVWGCERPELLITETLAFHARRTEDTASDSSGKDVSASANPDETFDQKIRPEGSLFVELFNPTPPNAAFSREFYDYDSAHSIWGIDLRKLAPSGAPIWRMAIVEADPDNNPATNDDDLDNPGLTTKPTILRTVYFTPFAGHAGDGRVYAPSPGGGLPPISYLPPGRYAVVGPGDKSQPGKSTTYLGFKGYPTLPVETFVDNTARRIVLEPSTDPNGANQVQIYSDGTQNDLTALGANIEKPLAVVINPPDDSTTGNPIRMSISEPTNSYKAYTGPNQYSPPEDNPLDRSANGATEVGGPGGAQYLVEMFDAVHTDGTTPRLRVIHLQRLANPLRPYNQNTNPYLTVDSMPVDLTSFNGLTGMDETPYGVAGGNNRFYARQRGECEIGRPDRIVGTPLNDERTYNWWPHGTNDSALTPEHAPTADVLPIKGKNAVPGPGFFTAEFDHTLGYLNEGYGDPVADNPAIGVPAGYPPFGTPWLAWNNRPFASQYEILKVPAYRSSRVLTKVQVVKPLGHVPPLASTDPKAIANRRPFGDAENLADVPAASNAATLHDPYGHTLNFFYSDPNYDSTKKTRELHRFLEFVHVPSRFVGTDLTLNPWDIRNTPGHSFHSPYNHISKYREPGRINLNTVFSENVWRGLTNGFPHGSPDPITGRSWQWNRFLRSRQGYESALEAMINMGALNPSAGSWAAVWQPLWKDALERTGENVLSRPLRMDPNYPTRFAKPFRSSYGASLVPPILLDPANPNPATDPSLMPMREVEATALRSGAGKVYQPLKDPTQSLTAAEVEIHRGLDFSNHPLFTFEPETSDFAFDPSLAPGAAFQYYLDEKVAAIPPANGGLAIPDQLTAIWRVNTTVGSEDVSPQPYWGTTEMQTFITDYDDPMRNPYFRYQGLQRLGNVTTTRSNVYAVWLTVGYFEVEPRPTARKHADGSNWTPAEYNAVYPDGYAIGQELGSDTGDIKRHRAFYLFDRSIPVGFERGKDHNVEDAILIRRYIE